MKLKTFRGFTIVELLITIAIISILITVTITSFALFKNRADESAALQEAAQNLHVIYATLVLDEDLSDTKDIVIYVRNNNNRFVFKYDDNVLKPIDTISELSDIRTLIINESSIIYSNDDHEIVGISDDTLKIIKSNFGISDDVELAGGKLGDIELLSHPDIS